MAPPGFFISLNKAAVAGIQKQDKKRMGVIPPFFNDKTMNPKGSQYLTGLELRHLDPMFHWYWRSFWPVAYLLMFGSMCLRKLYKADPRLCFNVS